MYVSLGQIDSTAVTVRPSVSGIKGLDAIDLKIASAVTITSPLASSPSQNEAMRRNLAVVLDQTADAAGKYAAQLSSELGWDAEPKALLALKTDAERLSATLSAKPNEQPSWAILDTGVRGLQSRLTSTRSAIFAKASSEAEAAKNRARGMILGFVASKPMSEDDWAKVSKLADAVQADVDKIAKLPLSPADAPGFLGVGRQLQGEIDSRLETVSTGFMNSAERLGRSAGLSPQRGRWIAAWAERNKWAIAGAGALGAGLVWMRRRQR